MQSEGVRRLDPEPPRSWFQFVGSARRKISSSCGVVVPRKRCPRWSRAFGDAAAAKVPQVAELAQVFGRIEFCAGLADAHGVEMGHARELIGRNRSNGR